MNQQTRLPHNLPSVPFCSPFSLARRWLRNGHQINDLLLVLVCTDITVAFCNVYASLLHFLPDATCQIKSGMNPCHCPLGATQDLRKRGGDRHNRPQQRREIPIREWRSTFGGICEESVKKENEACRKTLEMFGSLGAGRSGDSR